MIKLFVSIGLLILFLLPGCKSGQDDMQNASSDSKTRNWSIFRGDKGFTGVASGELPDQPQLLWSFKTANDIKSSAVSGSGLVFIGSNDGYVYALELETGSKKWQYNTEDDIEAAPLFVDEMIYIGSVGGNFYAINALNGKLIWKFETGGQIHGSANWVQPSGSSTKSVMVGSYDNLMYSFDALSGKLQWTYETEYFINGSPATDGENVIFGGCDEGVHIVSVADGQKKGEVEAGAYIAGSAAISGNRAYIGHYGDKLICIDLSAQKTLWEYGNEKKGGAFFSSPAVNDHVVIIGSRDRFVHCVNRENGELIWKFRTRDDVDSSPVICGNRVVVGSSDGRIYILDLNDGSKKWSYEIGAAITGSPAVTAGKIIIGADDGTVYAFGESK